MSVNDYRKQQRPDPWDSAREPTNDLERLIASVPQPIQQHSGNPASTEGIPKRAWSKEADMMESWANPASTGREADHLAVIEEAAQVLESAAAHNRKEFRSVLAYDQQNRANRLRAAHAYFAARTAATSTAPDKLDTDAEKLDFATTFDVDEFMREYSKYGPEVAAFSIWLVARAGNFLNSGAATSTQAARAPGEAIPGYTAHSPGCKNWGCTGCFDPDELARMLAPSPHSPVGAKEQDK